LTDLQTFCPPQTLRTPDSLVREKLAASDRLPMLEAVAARYAVAITPDMAGLCDGSDPADPIARQFVPTAGELTLGPDERADPIGDDLHSPVQGIVHRYPDRVLLKLTHSCAVYCRFCFRREVVGPAGSGNLSSAALKAALDYIAARPAIWEVILSGGDPLILSPRRLRGVISALGAIEHVKVVRIHSRVPVVDPARITSALVDALQCPGKAVWVALHANHPRELTAPARRACARIVDAGLPMIGQTVLLAGVNDDPQVLGALMRAMVETRIKPYYLHQGDLAPGTAHFRTTIDEGQGLLRSLRGAVSGLCQPTYVLDIPGGHGKVPIGPAYLSRGDGGGTMVEDPSGALHLYPPIEASRQSS
jgi:lysine 2,3-aminomutase